MRLPGVREDKRGADRQRPVAVDGQVQEKTWIAPFIPAAGLLPHHGIAACAKRNRRPTGIGRSIVLSQNGRSDSLRRCFNPGPVEAISPTVRMKGDERLAAGVDGHITQVGAHTHTRIKADRNCAASGHACGRQPLDSYLLRATRVVLLKLVGDEKVVDRGQIADSNCGERQ